ncbi:MAG TPA: hypothetical protein VFM70_10035 [Salinimicrobium sp.]|nr:hypothetical protein [Salinimicrobium sp.]
MFCFLSLMAIFASCSTDEQEVQMEEMNVEVQESISLRVTLENIKNMNPSTTGKNVNATDAADELCFQFEYPITLEYNTGTQVTANNYEELLSILLDESVAVHLTGIGFPFEIIQYSTNTTLTIDDEAEFENLVEACGYDSIGVVDVVALTANCFDVNYPITVLINELPETFNSQADAENYFYGNIQTIESIGFQYPFSVHLASTDTDLQINSDYEVVNLINDTCGIY